MWRHVSPDFNNHSKIGTVTPNVGCQLIDLYVHACQNLKYAWTDGSYKILERVKFGLFLNATSCPF